MRGDLAGWAARRAPDLIARAEAEAVAELKAALIAAATAAAPAADRPAPRAPEPRPAPEPEPPVTGDAVWAYCVARDTPGADGPGVASGDTRWVREGELAVLCSTVPLAEFGEEPLTRSLNDLEWLERVARAHEAAIARALDGATIVPLRLCTIFASEEHARAMLAERAGELSAALDRLEGKLEWAVKLLIDRERLQEGLRDTATEAAHEPGSGAAYMLLRREERRLAEAAERAASGLAEDVHARLQDWAADARVRPAQNRELSGHTGDMILNGAYLVDRGKTDELRDLVEQLQLRHADVGARLELGGPFPPYSFVPETR